MRKVVMGKIQNRLNSNPNLNPKRTPMGVRTEYNAVNRFWNL